MVETLRFVATLALEFAVIFLVVTFAVHLLVASVPKERLRRAMAGRPWRGTGLALVFGAVTPFCSCSTVPVVAGMAAAGVPVVALTAFLVLSPLVNPATVALLATLVSPLYALAFVAASMLLALTVAGVVSTLGVRPVVAMGAGLGSDATGALPGAAPRPLPARVGAAAGRAWRDLRALAPFLVAVAAVGGLLYGRVDATTIGTAVDAAGPWAVPMAVLLGAPVYASTAVLLPLGAGLLATGANLGVVTAFLVGATGLSLPEGILLQRLLGWRYLATLAVAFVAAAIVLGYAIQALAGGWQPI